MYVFVLDMYLLDTNVAEQLKFTSSYHWTETPYLTELSKAFSIIPLHEQYSCVAM